MVEVEGRAVRKLLNNWFIKWVIAPVVVLSGTTFAIYSLHTNGYCIFERRFVTQSEMIKIAVKSELFMLSQSQKFEDETLKQNDLVTHFSSVDDFLHRNPDCCSLVGNINNYEIYGSYPLIVGHIANSVRLEYQFEYRNQQGILASRSHTQEIPISSCGKIAVELYRNPIGRPFL
jgi:hypothetical protein